ncbi:asparagine synthase [Lapidilactobacillus dextrinicus DSM 20335]|uniref:asparagine synthase (glutamine-hydrolyzing) n=1 Tax=Lapidilactobacillus dextrinicus DSM 20335 TaxID=1423738 RepID=A0A0R2BTM7_9LACO|nr:asparagine synthase (glutamine-hydrolyzing) [Lapidilactobacillus dextrinicus]KRM79334.1 asparagine synthase [Lapidilactobacillus dextrinicus DSM 20335]QFG46832.1 asparagine synthase (glutamine-hydrolyzing) [Lapidilactobacillus dextrinicus]
MCGFVGAIHQDGGRVTLDDIKTMNQMIVHRGPDDEGYFEDDSITTGFRRLSIIDLQHGSQPLAYDQQRYWIVFNGEIYNYVELREELLKEGYQFITDSDTEVILAMYKKYGTETAKYLRGMFAFVIWDTQTKEVYGARDQFGIKPLHYALANDNIYFASEKKSLIKLLNDRQIDEVALQNYLTYQYVPDPETLTPSIKKIPAGHYFVKNPGEALKIETYFTPTFTPQTVKDENKLATKIAETLYDSVKKHMRADVTVGSFLSGGVDSSIIVALAKQISPNIKTFSVGFEREGYSEIDVAEETAQRLGVENISQVITPEAFIKEFPNFVYSMDDPLADPAAVPQYFLAKLARQYCKVALTGEGADELFGGYTIYNEPNSLTLFEHLPQSLNHVLNKLAQQLPAGVKGRSFIERGTTPLERRFVGNAKIFLEPEKKQLLQHYQAGHPYTNVTAPFYHANQNLDPITRMEDIDMHTWLIGDLLLNADRTTMAASLELRTPFIDKEVFALARTIPANLKIAHNTTKYILRKAAESFTPENVLYRPKLGFPVPIRFWLKDELADWARDLIEQAPVDQYLKKDYALKLLDDHQVGRIDNSRKLWTILTFIVWYQIYISQDYHYFVDPTPISALTDSAKLA